jgi:signal-transduction protein with cAMP-binding, CBS, and nucleotidyltransferase domain
MDTGVGDLRVRDFASRGLVTVHAHQSLRTAAVLLSTNEVGALLVDCGSGALGILTEHDLSQAIADGVDVNRGTVDQYMTADPAEVDEEQGLVEAIVTMHRLGVRHLMVTRQGLAWGMVSARDVLRALSRLATSSASGQPDSPSQRRRTRSRAN